jgi:hypothetical protein
MNPSSCSSVILMARLKRRADIESVHLCFGMIGGRRSFRIVGSILGNEKAVFENHFSFLCAF